ncbi:MAG: hypothetical protein ABW051_05315 [Burkholderiaceae bacterium]
MRSEVNVRLDAATEFSFDLEEVQPIPHDAARVWLDEQFMLLGCEPLRPTGKLLIADKVVCVAQAAGAQRLRDAEWSRQFARAASAALAKPVVRVDVPSMTIGY